jgi:hypothetical protein
LIEHPGGDLWHETGFLGDGKEIQGRNRTESWVHPPKQRLNRRNRAAAQVELRLEMEGQLAAADRRTQLIG